MRPALKLIVVLGLVFCSARLSLSAEQFSPRRYAHLNNTAPSDRSELKGDLEQPGAFGYRFFGGEFPAFAESVFRGESFATEGELLPQRSFSTKPAALSFHLIARPPPA